MTPLGLLFQMLALLLSPFGLMSVMFGFLLFLLGPFIYQYTGIGKVFVSIPLWVMARILNRAAIVVTEHNDIFLKRMEFDDLGVETISFGDERKDFEDPDGAIHNWLGMHFALADEVTGTLFDPRHAAIGSRKATLDTNGKGRVNATEDEFKSTGVGEWVKGVFEMPTDHELVDLSAVRRLVDGGERSEYPKRTEELYKHSRRVLSSGTPAMKFIYPIIGFLATFGGIFLVMDQLGGASSAETVTVSTLAAFATLKPYTGEIKRVAAMLLAILPVIAIGYLTTPVLAGLLALLFALGYLFIPIIALFSRPIGPLAGIFAKILIMLGLVGFDRPVLHWYRDKYRLTEFDDLEDPNVSEWYNLANSRFGFSHPPTPESFDAEVMDSDSLKDRQMSQDKSTDSNIPTDQVPLHLSYRGNIAPFGPKHPSTDSYYIHSGIALSRFEDSAMGQKSQRRLTQAKEVYGEGGFGIDDKTILYATLFTMVLGIGLGTLVFIL